MNDDWPWYMTIRALREYMIIAGYSGPAEDDNPGYRRAEAELGALTVTAVDTDRRTDSGAAIYRSADPARPRVGPGQRQVRLEFTVSFAARPEGDLPQLVRVRDRGGRKRPAR